jgi:hypothetical protein
MNNAKKEKKDEHILRQWVRSGVSLRHAFICVFTRGSEVKLHYGEKMMANWVSHPGIANYWLLGLKP